MRKRAAKGGLLLNLFTWFLLPAYTLLFAGSMEWFDTNFSVLAVTGRDHYRGFFFWGVLASLVFGVLLVRIIHALPGKWGKLPLYLLTYLALSAMAYTLMIPYLPESWPGYASLHVALAAGSCVLVMVDILWILVRRCYRDFQVWKGCLYFWSFTVVGAAILFAMAGMVSSALEVFFTLTVDLLLRRMFLLSRPGGAD